MRPEDKDRQLQKFRSLRGRSLEVSFKPVAPEVPAKTPEELEEATRKALEEETSGDLPS